VKRFAVSSFEFRVLVESSGDFQHVINPLMFCRPLQGFAGIRDQTHGLLRGAVGYDLTPFRGCTGIAPLDAARTAQRAIPAKKRVKTLSRN
jgi:hypothetical protein